jgi:hypothetical protein
MTSTDADRKATIIELIRFIWPLDVFAVAATILRRTGGYVRVLELPRSAETRFPEENWPQTARDIASRWRTNLNQFIAKNSDIYEPSVAALSKPGVRAVAPKEVREWWTILLEHGDDAISEISSEDSEPTQSLIRLCCVADDACRGFGIRGSGMWQGRPDLFLNFSAWVLEQQHRRTGCISIPEDRIAVLPKQHTPQRGLTLRSLTHNLSLHPATEVTPTWRAPIKGKSRELINLLLLPWPTETRAGDFRVLDNGDSRTPCIPPSSRFFEYEPQQPIAANFAARLEEAFKKAQAHAEEIHAVIFPELALSVDEFRIAEKFVFDKRALLMAGVRVKDGELDCIRGRNSWIFQVGGLLEAASALTQEDISTPQYRVRQSKHHRWCLDRSQILQYQLGGRLPASKDCWELTDVTDRQVEFFTIDSWLTWAVLICEDLARQDPVAEVIRSVGPNMVVALLMDGPQIKERWPSRYASVLAEDPGSSVLTITSLGMSLRTQGANREKDRSRVIALWRDTSFGAREIELGPDHDACVLSLVCKTKVEYSADGRSDGGAAHFPVFAGIHSFNSAGRDPSAATGTGVTGLKP